jgi:hypothetical protein
MTQPGQGNGRGNSPRNDDLDAWVKCVRETLDTLREVLEQETGRTP